MFKLNIFSLVIGIILGKGFDYFNKRPKLSISGGGSGGGPGPGFHQNYIHVINKSGLFGFKIRETVIFGKRIHNFIQKGLVFDRFPAHECTAFLYDKKTKEFIKQLYWTSKDDWCKKVQTVTLNSGEGSNLMIFARLDSEKNKYFVFQPDTNNTGNPLIPNNEEKFSDTKEFILEIQYAYGQKKIKTNIKMTKKINGMLYFEYKSGGSSF